MLVKNPDAGPTQIQHLDLRSFPKGYLEDQDFETILTGLRHCVCLRSLTWTRDGTLSDEIFDAVLDASSPGSSMISDLQINGNNTGHYKASRLLAFSSLRKLTLIMPSRDVMSALEFWTSKISSTLQDLSLICKVGAPILTVVHS